MAKPWVSIRNVFCGKAVGKVLLMVLPWVIIHGKVLDNNVRKAVSNLTHGIFLGNELPTRQNATDSCRG
ncbi:unnamed protein product [Trifolium pratense]|uniref:Uncharacterized protein n=1 Tax=Trifolium pratense TaxID=57577 RepID=A0ACB0JWT9_TRIPR|nr:unnamed protein product [Trifolium pratense]